MLEIRASRGAEYGMQRRAELSRRLDRYRPVDELEVAHQAAMLRLLEASGDPFSRHHFDPGHFTASAYVLAGDAVAMVFHGTLKRWLQPGGHVESDDRDLEDAARREVAEETGLIDLSAGTGEILDLDVHGIPAHDDRPAHRHFDVRFLFRSPRTALCAGSDAATARWIDLAELERTGLDPGARRVFGKLRHGRAQTPTI